MHVVHIIGSCHFYCLRDTDRKLLDSCSTEVVSLVCSIATCTRDCIFCAYNNYFIDSSQIEFQIFAEVDLNMPLLSISYIAGENESTVWPGMTVKKT